MLSKKDKELLDLLTHTTGQTTYNDLKEIYSGDMTDLKISMVRLRNCGIIKTDDTGNITVLEIVKDISKKEKIAYSLIPTGKPVGLYDNPE